MCGRSPWFDWHSGASGERQAVSNVLINTKESNVKMINTLLSHVALVTRLKGRTDNRKKRRRIATGEKEQKATRKEIKGLKIKQNKKICFR